MIVTFADMIRHRRSNLELTMDKLAEKASIRKSTISKIENGEVRKPEYKTIKSLAEALDISYDDYIGIYISLERNAEVMLDILQEAISTSKSIFLITDIATKYLELPHLDSYDAIKQMFITANHVNDTSIRFALFKTITKYSRSHGVMPFIAQGMYKTYMIERNDFTQLENSYQTGKSVLSYADFLNEDDQIIFYFSLANHSYSLLRYNDCLDYCKIVSEIDQTNSQYRAHVTFLMCNCHYYLKNYETSKMFLAEYNNYSFEFVQGNVNFMTGCINGRSGKVDLGIQQLEQYLKVTSEFNLVYVVTMLLELYLIKCDLGASRRLLEYEVAMKDSLIDKYTTPDKKARMAYFYQLAGNALVSQDVEVAFDFYLKSASKYMEIGLYDNALKSVVLINEAILEDHSRLSIEVVRKMNEIYKQIISKKINE
ncbi:helix-turn-helix domain-containing protein [Paenibacillus arenosi]|uniref:Helix-turn-helix transcriptional regulator n=1 Tax=Paenibacillus arenosi TaxID=2774142 RepID=A0ABR9B3H2_9BACL|nr:helix-turn-helix transcriptional regulator [Paenibacillus arenosi]MBD8500919.1 helix-turn-helix transcriptional regulator [Paenibacillus arenosi]